MQLISFTRSTSRQGLWSAATRHLILAGTALLAMATAVSTAQAQAGTVAGTVVSPGGQPVADAQVRVDGANRATVTDASGRFRVSGLTGPTVTVEVRRIGYRMARQTVPVGSNNLRFNLTEQSVALDRVVVTGTPGGQARREVGNAVSTINAVEANELAEIPNVQQLINGRAAGVFVNSATGNVGAGARIRIRGAGSISLLNEPLLYVDGIRVNNAPATGPENQSFGSSSISRINDINPDEIESIEIIKGPAAATLYGTEASNGVIQIITKKGTVGRPRWNFTARQGRNYIRDPEGRWPVNYQAVPRFGGPAGARDTISIDIIERENARGTPVFRGGNLQEYDLSAAGGTDLIRYYAAGGLEDSEGADRANESKRYNGRLNLNLAPNPKFNLGFNMGYASGDIALPAEAGFGGAVWTTVLADARNLFNADGSPNPRRGFHSGLPEQYAALYVLTQNVDRFTAGIQLNHQPYSWFRHRLAAGTDRTRETNNNMARRINDSLTKAIHGTDALGYRDIVDRTINYYTLDYSASGIYNLASAVRSTTTLGSQYYRNSTQFVEAYGEVFPTPGLTAIDATTQNRATSGDLFEDATLGFFVQEQLGWRDRFFATAAIRADDNSAFGQNFDRVYYPKYSLSWVISEEPFWRWPMVNALKLRAAYGESGKQPATYSALQTYAAATGPNDVATVTPQFIGNADLGPERGKEVELGFDAGAWDDRLGFEFTWYRKRTTDAILNREIPPSLGIPSTQPFNAGAIRNWGTEWLLRAKPVMLSRVEWDLALNYGTNDSKILNLGTPPAILALRAVSGTPDFVSGGSFIRHQVGYPIGSYFQKLVVSAQQDAAGHVIANTVMCADGKGGSKLCAGADLKYGTADDAPAVYIGRSLPKSEGSVSNTLTLFRRLRFYGLVDFKHDYRKVNGNTRVRCTFFGGRCRENFYPTEFDATRIAGIESSRNLVNFFIEDAGYTKLRELSVSYTLPETMGRVGGFNRAVVTLAGRNLRTWTNYTGLEPEAFFLGGSRGGNFGQWEQATMPQLAQWVLSVNLDW